MFSLTIPTNQAFHGLPVTLHDTQQWMIHLPILTMLTPDPKDSTYPSTHFPCCTIASEFGTMAACIIQTYQKAPADNILTHPLPE